MYVTALKNAIAIPLSPPLSHPIHVRPPLRYGEVVNINLVRDKKTGQSKGYCFLGYENQKSTILAVDNFNGIKVSSSRPWC